MRTEERAVYMLNRGDEIQFANHSVRVETVAVYGGRASVTGRTSEGGCPIITKHYPATMFVNVRVKS